MDTLGPKLKAAREALNLTQSQVAELTRIKTQQIDGLERDDFSSIPAAMYAKGFIKLYAQVVELDPDPLLELYVLQTQTAQPGKAKLRESARKAMKPAETPAETPAQASADPSPMEPEVTRAQTPEAEAVSETDPPAEPPSAAEKPRASHLIKRNLPVREPRKSFRETLSEALRPKIGLLREMISNLPLEQIHRNWPRVAAGVLLLLLLALLPRACRREPSHMDDDGQLLISNPYLVEPSALRFTLESPAP